MNFEKEKPFQFSLKTYLLLGNVYLCTNLLEFSACYNCCLAAST